MNAVRDMGRDIDRRLTQIEKRLSETDARLKRIEDAQQALKGPNPSHPSAYARLHE